MGNVDRSLVKISGTAEVFQRPLGFDPTYVIVDNMTDADAYLYSGIVSSDPIANGTLPLDVIPKKDFKIIVAPAGVRNYTVAVGASTLGATPYINIILTDDEKYVKQFHQTNLPNVAVTVAGTIATTNAAASQVDGHSVSLGSTTDIDSSGDGSVIAVLKRLRTLLGGTLTTNPIGSATAVSATAAANTAVTLTIAASGAGISHRIKSVHFGWSGAVPAAGFQATIVSGSLTLNFGVGTVGLSHIFSKGATMNANTNTVITLPAGGASVVGSVTVEYEAI